MDRSTLVCLRAISSTRVVRAFRGGGERRGREGTGGKEGVAEGRLGKLEFAQQRCSIGFDRGAAGCLAATTELYLSAV